AVAAWQTRWRADRPPTLAYRRTLDSLLIDDDRAPERPASYVVRGPLAWLYEFCSDTMRTVAHAVEHLQPNGPPLAEDEVRAALEEFCRASLMVTEDGRYLSLALPAYRYG